MPGIDQVTDDAVAAFCRKDKIGAARAIATQLDLATAAEDHQRARPAAEAAPARRRPDDRGRPAAGCGRQRSASLLIVAPPGCGKTELLALRAHALIPRLLPGQKILALTFTNRAKANLSERLRRLLGTQRMRRYVTVRNFHGHAAEIVLAHGRTIGLPARRARHARRPRP